MTGDVLVLAEGAGDTFVDSTFELIGRARLLAGGGGGRVLALVIGPAPDPAALDADLVLTVAPPNLTAYSPEAFLEVVHAVVAERGPKLVLMANTTAGMDLGAGLSVRWGKPLAA